jgi:hypothetical protein
MCWPANIVGAFFIALIAADILQKKYGDILYHSVIGGILTAVFWGLCVFVGTGISAGVLVIPLLFTAIFLFTIWFTNESMKKRGCCLTCDGDKKKRLQFVKRDKPLYEEHDNAPVVLPSTVRQADVDIGDHSGYRKRPVGETPLISGVWPTFLPSAILASSQGSCVNNKLTATPI